MTFESHSSCMSFPQDRSEPMKPFLPEAKRKAKDERHVSCVCGIMVPVARLKFSFHHPCTDGGATCMIETEEKETGFLKNRRENLLYAACLPADTAAMWKSYGNSD